VEAEARARHSILSVDDDEDVLALLHEIVSSLGHDSSTAADGVDAIEKLNEQHFDIVITDINMPRMDGTELIRKICAEHEDIDVIAVTGYHNNYSYTDVIEAGASDFIAKPFNVNELEAKINRILRERTQREQLKHLSLRDGLTGLYNRRHFDENIKREAGRAFRQHYGLYLLLIDVDNFKNYNDRYGHQQGDKVLKELAHIMMLHIRENVDSCYRYGGDEFAVIIPHANLEQAVMVAERLRTRYNDCKLEPTSLSIGIASLEGSIETMEENIQQLLLNADRNLYAAKNKGGDQICTESQRAS